MVLVTLRIGRLMDGVANVNKHVADELLKPDRLPSWK